MTTELQATAAGFHFGDKLLLRLPSGWIFDMDQDGGLTVYRAVEPEAIPAAQLMAVIDNLEHTARRSDFHPDMRASAATIALKLQALFGRA